MKDSVSASTFVSLLVDAFRVSSGYWDSSLFLTALVITPMISGMRGTIVQAIMIPVTTSPTYVMETLSVSRLPVRQSPTVSPTNPV